MSSKEKQSPAKKVSIIRWNAIIPFILLSTLVILYFHFFFDKNMRSALEWAGYKALGSEVNIANFETSFMNASLKIQGIEITDSEKPTHDSIKIGEVRFSALWDALLRVKFVVNEAAVEQIEFSVPRSRPGKVAPPEPVSNEPSLISKEAENLKGEALKQAQEEYNDNALGDIVAMIGGSDPNSQLEKIQDSLASKEMLKNFESDFKTKQTSWNQKLKTLPQGPEIQALSDRLNKIKYKDFKSAPEVQQSLQELDSVLKEADSKFKAVQTVNSDLTKDLNEVQTRYKEIEQQIKKDIQSLEAHFRIPKIDAKSLSKAIFKKYSAPYMAKINKYRSLAEKYLPPKLLKKNKPEKEDDLLQPHPRENGISYEFGKPNAYPLIWIKSTKISSQAGLSPYSGNIKGEISNITTNQKQIQKPTILTISGDFPSSGVQGFNSMISLDNRKPESIISFKMSVEKFPIEGKELVQSPEVQIAFNKASGKFNLEAELFHLKKLAFIMDSSFSSIDYKISSKNEIADQILKSVFNGIPVVNLSTKITGELPSTNIDINSNIGSELQKGFEKQIQAKIEEAKKKIQSFINEQIGKQKSQIDNEIAKAKEQVNKEIQKVQSQLDQQKKQAESKVEQAKKDINQQGTKKVEEEAKKALDSLKSQFGL